MAMGKTDAMGEDHLEEVSVIQSFSLAVKSYKFVLSSRLFGRAQTSCTTWQR